MQYPEKQADWLGLVLGLARFEICHWPPDVQNSKAIVLGLTLGLARFDSGDRTLHSKKVLVQPNKR